MIKPNDVVTGTETPEDDSQPSIADNDTDPEQLTIDLQDTESGGL